MSRSFQPGDLVAEDSEPGEKTDDVLLEPDLYDFVNLPRHESAPDELQHVYQFDFDLAHGSLDQPGPIITLDPINVFYPDNVVSPPSYLPDLGTGALFIAGVGLLGLRLQRRSCSEPRSPFQIR